MTRQDVDRLTWGALQLLGAAVVLRGLEWAFEKRPLAGVAVGAFLLDWWSTRLGARWSPAEGSLGPGAPRSLSQEHPLARSMRAAVAGLALSLVVILLATLLGVARIEAGHFAAIGVVLGAARAGAQALLDELLLRGIPLALLRGHASDRAALAFCVLLAMAPWAAEPGVRWDSLAFTASAALLLTLVWQKGAGGLTAWGLHTGWLVGTQVAMRGALLEVRWTEGALSPAPHAAGPPAWIATALLLVSAIWLFDRRKSLS